MSDTLQTRGPQAVARPAYIKESSAGHENIESRFIKPPALKLAQGTSPEIKRVKPEKFIEGLREGDLFDSLSHEIYGEGPIGVVIVNPLGHRNIEFDKDGRVVEFDVPDNDARTQWTHGIDPETGAPKRLKPRATTFLDFAILALLPGGRRRLMTMSLKSTQLKKGGEILSTIAGNKLPCYAYQWDTTAAGESKGDRTWYGYRFAQTWPTEDVYLEAEQLYLKLRGKIVEVETDAETVETDEAIPF